MTLSKDVYNAIKAVVGSENISDEPWILDSYARQSGLAAKPHFFVPRFEAIVLPQTTEEVTAIVKICNRCNVQFKPTSTSWGFFSDPSGPGAIQLDLRRMNRIIEINENNMYAVVEPYVIFAQLQAELMKRGLNCNVTGAGSNCSALPLAAHIGGGHLGQTASWADRNLLGVEWVTPDGEILRLGSLGSSGDWFCGDGPGPSLRGIIRGASTPLGGLGVYTKAATKVYHWAGPPSFEIEGISPDYYPREIPSNFFVHYYSFPSLDQRKEAVRKIGESEIALELMAFDITMVASNIATSNKEDVDLLEQLRNVAPGPGFMVSLAGNSMGEYNYKKRVLDEIINETKGKSLKMVEDPKIGAALLWRCIRITGSIRETFRSTGVFGGAVGGDESFECMTNFINKVAELKEIQGNKGLIRNDKGKAMGWTAEHGHYGHGELLTRYFPSPESAESGYELITEAHKIAIEEHYGVPYDVSGEDNNKFGPHASDFHIWLKHIKKTFDPKGASESTHYI